MAPRFSHLMLGLLLTALVTGCNSKKRIEFEIGKFRDELKEERKEAAIKLQQAEAKVQDLELRLAQMEKEAAEALEMANSAVTQQSEGFASIERTMGEIIQYQQKDETYAYVWDGFEGHTALRTEHGAFLIRLEEISRDFERNTYVAKLNIGNPMGLHILEYKLSGDFGIRAPKISPGEDRAAYNERITEWQKTLTPFETTVVETLKPNSWTRVSVPLAAKSREELQLIRFAMNISRAHLEGQDGGTNMTAIDLTSKGAVTFESKYGAFLGTVEKIEPEGTGIRIYMLIGNPFGFIINSCILEGDSGELPPRQLSAENAESYGARFIAWSDGLKPFQAKISSPIAPFRWSNVSFFVPDGTPDTIQLLRARLAIENITLKAPEAPGVDRLNLPQP